MAKRTQRHGVSGNPAKRAGVIGPAPTSSSDHSQGRLQSYLLGAAIVVATLVALFLRPGGDESPTGTEQDMVAPSAQTTPASQAEAPRSGTPRRATDEAFCAKFLEMAESQGRYVSDGERSPELLQRSADGLLEVGVPDTMSLPARTGYYGLISGVYDSIGSELAPEAVGAAVTSFDGADAAFTAYLDQYCPA